MRLPRVTAEWIHAEPFRAQVERSGIRVTARDVPVSLRTHLEEGMEITNFGVHDPVGPLQSNQRDLVRDVLHRFGTHPMGCEIPVDRTERELCSIRDQLVTGAKLKGEVSRWLMDARQWNFFITVVAESHRAGHVLWPELLGSQAVPPPAAALDVYKQVDEGIGLILD